MKGLAIGGLTPFTTVDYPGQHAAVIFCQGCSWRCPYCHNAHLWGHTSPTSLNWLLIMDFLRERQGLLDAVVFSGGEPLIQEGLPEAMREVRAMGYHVGLHTGGSHPERLRRVLPLVNWIGFDVKAPWNRYDEITRNSGSAAKAQESLLAILGHGVPFEVRTTVHSGLLSSQDLHLMAKDLEELGIRDWVLQDFRNQGCAEMSLVNTTETFLTPEAMPINGNRLHVHKRDPFGMAS